MSRYLLALAGAIVCGGVALLIRRRRRSELERDARRLSSLGTVDAHRERRQ